jgi:low temperature requirement protein LtrA
MHSTSIKIHVSHLQNKHVQGKAVGFRKITIFLGVFNDSTRAIHCSLLVDLTGEVFLTKCRGKGLKNSCFNLYLCWQTADFIISLQAFLTIGSLVLISNFAY